MDSTEIPLKVHTRAPELMELTGRNSACNKHENPWKQLKKQKTSVVCTGLALL